VDSKRNGRWVFFLALGPSNHNGRTFELKKKSQTVSEFSFISLTNLNILRAENNFFYLKYLFCRPLCSTARGGCTIPPSSDDPGCVKS
jgi:hypothetical protein